MKKCNIPDTAILIYHGIPQSPHMMLKYPT